MSSLREEPKKKILWGHVLISAPVLSQYLASLPLFDRYRYQVEGPSSNRVGATATFLGWWQKKAGALQPNESLPVPEVVLNLNAGPSSSLTIPIALALNNSTWHKDIIQHYGSKIYALNPIGGQCKICLDRPGKNILPSNLDLVEVMVATELGSKPLHILPTKGEKLVLIKNPITELSRVEFGMIGKSLTKMVGPELTLVKQIGNKIGQIHQLNENNEPHYIDLQNIYINGLLGDAGRAAKMAVAKARGGKAYIKELKSQAAHLRRKGKLESATEMENKAKQLEEELGEKVGDMLVGAGFFKGARDKIKDIKNKREASKTKAAEKKVEKAKKNVELEKLEEKQKELELEEQKKMKELQELKLKKAETALQARNVKSGKSSPSPQPKGDVASVKLNIGDHMNNHHNRDHYHHHDGESSNECSDDDFSGDENELSETTTSEPAVMPHVTKETTDETMVELDQVEDSVGQEMTHIQSHMGRGGRAILNLRPRQDHQRLPSRGAQRLTFGTSFGEIVANDAAKEASKVKEVISQTNNVAAPTITPLPVNQFEAESDHFKSVVADHSDSYKVATNTEILSDQTKYNVVFLEPNQHFIGKKTFLKNNIAQLETGLKDKANSVVALRLTDGSHVDLRTREIYKSSSDKTPITDARVAQVFRLDKGSRYNIYVTLTSRFKN